MLDIVLDVKHGNVCEIPQDHKKLQTFLVIFLWVSIAENITYLWLHDTYFV